VAAEFAPAGPEAITLLTGAARVVEELWHDEPLSTWQAAKKRLRQGHDRHEVIHHLAERSLLPSGRSHGPFSRKGNGLGGGPAGARLP
jgi:hypothetical protein